MKENIKNSNRYVYIDLLKCIAIFFVIVYHSTIYPYNFLIDNRSIIYGNYLVTTIFSTGVPIFFLVNGYLLLNKEFNLKKHIKKIIHMILLTIAWNIIIQCILMIIKNEYFSIKQVIINLCILKEGYVNFLWYLGAIICIYIFFPLIKNVFDTNRKIFIYFIIICFILTFGNNLLNNLITLFGNLVLKESIYIQETNFFIMFNPFRNIYGYTFVYFCIGGLLHSVKDKIEISTKKRNIFCIMMIIINCICLSGMGIYYSNITSTIYDVVWNGYDTIFTFINVICIFILCLSYSKDNTIIRTISTNSLGIYFIHHIVIQLTNQTLLQYNLPMNLLYSFIILCLSLLISLILRRIPFIKKVLL